MTTVCAEICQHPACWKSERDALRKHLKTLHNSKNHVNTESNFHTVSNNQKYECGKRKDTIFETGDLPTYTVLNLLHSGFPYQNESHEYSDGEMQQWSSCHLQQSNECDTIDELSVAQRSSLNCLKKICLRQKEVEEKESNKCNASSELSLKTLHLEDAYCISVDNEKIYTFVPGKKSKKHLSKISNETNQKVNVTIIDGACLPVDNQIIESNRSRWRVVSPTGGQSYKFTSASCRFPPITNEKMLECLNENVYIPSPLRTKRMPLEQSKLPCKQIRVEVKKEETVQAEKNTAYPCVKEKESNAKTLYIKDGVMLPKSPCNKKPSSVQRENLRSSLHLTKVSVPKKVIGKIPLFDHCSSSIKRADLPEVLMKPLSGSEGSSNVSCRLSLVDDISTNSIARQNSNNDAVMSIRSVETEIFRAPAPLPLGTRSKTCPYRHPNCNSQLSFKNIISCVADENSIIKDLPARAVENEANYFPNTTLETTSDTFKKFDDRQNVVQKNNAAPYNAAPSAIMNFKASQSATNIELQRSTLYSDSPVLSTLSKHSSDEFEKDFIQRTYEKYQSLTPFKTPMGSRHVIRGEETPIEQSLELRDLRSSTVSRRKSYPQSMQKLNQFSREEGTALMTNNSFMRSLSPARSMFIHQQKQPPQKTVPMEMKVSQVHVINKPLARNRNLRTESKLIHPRYPADGTMFLIPVPSFSAEISPTPSPNENDTEICIGDDSRITENVEDEEFLVNNEVMECAVLNNASPSELNNATSSDMCDGGEEKVISAEIVSSENLLMADTNNNALHASEGKKNSIYTSSEKLKNANDEIEEETELTKHSVECNGNGNNAWVQPEKVQTGEMQPEKLKTGETQLEKVQNGEIQPEKLQTGEMQPEKLQTGETQLEKVQNGEIQPEKLQTGKMQPEKLQTGEMQLEKVQNGEIQPEKLQTGEMQPEKLKTGETQLEKVQNGEIQPEKLQTGEMQPEKLQTGETQLEKVQNGEIQPEKLQTGEMQPEKLQTGEMQLEKVQNGEIQPEKLQTGEMQPEKLQTGEMQLEKVQNGEIHPEKLQTGEMQPEKLQTGEMQLEKGQNGEIQPEKLQTGEMQPEKLQTGEMQSEKVQSEEIWSEIVQIGEIQPIEIQTTEVQARDLKSEKIQTTEMRPEKVQVREIQPGEVQPKIVQIGERQPDNVRPEEIPDSHSLVTSLFLIEHSSPLRTLHSNKETAGAEECAVHLHQTATFTVGNDTSRANTPVIDMSTVQDFTEGLNFNLNVDEEVLEIMNGMDDFALDDYYCDGI